MENFKGKFLIRRHTMPNGKSVLSITGLAFPSENIESYSDNDEMWIANFTLTDVIKYVQPEGQRFNHSPEDFLEGTGLDVSDWELKKNK